jgi:hypothetical protein
LHATHKSLITEELLYYIAQLYDIERQVQGLEAAERQQIRQKTAAQIMDALYGWMIKKPAVGPNGFSHRQSAGLQHETLASADALPRRGGSAD